MRRVGGSSLALWASIAGFLFAGAAAVALADDDDDDDEGEDEDEGGDDGLHGSPGETTDEGYRAACWISNATGPSASREVILGEMYGAFNSSNSADRIPIGYHKASLCGFADNVGTFPAGTTFLARLASWYIMDGSTTIGSSADGTDSITLTIDAWTWTDGNCGGSGGSSTPLTSISFSKTSTDFGASANRYWWEKNRFTTVGTAPGYTLTAPSAGSSPDSFEYDLTVTTVINGGAPVSNAETSNCFAYSGS
jgi:hypothetical protein